MSLSKQQTLKEKLEGFQTVDDPDIINRFKSAIEHGLKYMKECEARRKEDFEKFKQDPLYHTPINAYNLS